MKRIEGNSMISQGIGIQKLNNANLRTTTPTVVRLRPVRTQRQMIEAALKEADTTAAELLTVWLARGESSTADSLLYAETCRAEGLADGLRQALEIVGR